MGPEQELVQRMRSMPCLEEERTQNRVAQGGTVQLSLQTTQMVYQDTGFGPLSNIQWEIPEEMNLIVVTEILQPREWLKKVDFNTT